VQTTLNSSPNIPKKAKSQKRSDGMTTVSIEKQAHELEKLKYNT
jgi:hypothetical protein